MQDIKTISVLDQNFRSTECEKIYIYHIGDNFIQIKPKMFSIFSVVLILLCLNQDEFA